MIILPKRFEEILTAAPPLHANVKSILETFGPWLEQSGMPFFPGFTDHSPRHINDVLETAASLISDDSYPQLGPEDIAILTMSVLLHDCGMHLTQDSFRVLIKDNTSSSMRDLGDEPWNQLWLDFLSEAKRFGEDKLFAVFGSKEPININALDINNLSELDCLLIGEFVRRHHTRLAHEIAIRGVPTNHGTTLHLKGIDEDFRDIAGLVARSHGMSIRSTFDYIKRRYTRIPEYRNAKIPYLMAILRIADYVQVQSERAIKSLLSVKELRSPISRQEWRNHFAVREVSTRHEDPEAIYVNAAPQDAKTFLRLESLFKDIQREIDDSWATIGEVYGRLGNLSHLGLSIRRIRSNLENRSTFGAHVPYIPTSASFKTSGPELLKLLVGPLYNYNAAIGVRELLQNAVDACRERLDLEANAEVKVSVKFDITQENAGWLTITDNGVGMSLNTITKYFLIAGASFRNSDAWKLQHIDQNGRTKILRGGRFGVGALAAFLLGEQIIVKTRHFRSPENEGLEFSARIDEPVLEIKKALLPIGTTIQVWINQEDVVKKLMPSAQHIVEKDAIGMLGKDIANVFTLNEWPAVDWFAHPQPSVSQTWFGPISKYDYTSGKHVNVIATAVFEAANDLIPLKPNDDWFSLPGNHDYESILWQYPKPEKRKDGDEEYSIHRMPSHTVNGIRIRSPKSYSREIIQRYSNDPYKGPLPTIERPSVSIQDPKGICPINLQRDSISFELMGIDEYLIQDILEKFFTSTIAKYPKDPSLKDLCNFGRSLNLQTGISFNVNLPPICASNKGIFLCTPHTLKELEINTLFLTSSTEFSDKKIRSILKQGQAILVRNRVTSGEQDTLGWFRGLFGSDAETWRATQHGLPNLPHESQLGIIRTSTWNLATTKGKVSKQLLKNISLIKNTGELVWVKPGVPFNDSSIEKDLTKLSSEIGNLGEVASWKILNDRIQNTPPTSLFSLKWAEHSQRLILPFNENRLKPS